jgi:hypothetical protein
MGNMLEMPIDEMVKHWLLNLAVEVPVWLYLLFPAVEGDALNVQPVPRRNAEDYAAGVMDLCEAGMIKLSSEVHGDDVENGAGISRILDRFLKLSYDDSILHRDGRLLKPDQRNRLPGMQVSFRLTALGGEAWERVAEPDWAHFVTESRDSTSGELISPDRDRLIAYMGWYPEIHRERIQLETVTWETHTNFEILYWKRLPFVYHASFGLQAAAARWASMAPPKWFRDWELSTASWYREPWSLSNWPTLAPK